MYMSWKLPIAFLLVSRNTDTSSKENNLMKLPLIHDKSLVMMNEYLMYFELYVWQSDKSNRKKIKILWNSISILEDDAELDMKFFLSMSSKMKTGSFKYFD